MRLFYYPKVKKGEKQVVHTYPIGVGRVGWATPEGATKIVRRQKDPTWRPTPSIIKEHRRRTARSSTRSSARGPDNPLGRYAFYLGWPSYMIHGTNKPSGVGLRSSHGCIRLYPEDIAQLFEMAPIGTQVRVVNQPFVFGWHDGSLHIQAFDVLEDDTRDWKKAQVKLLKKDLAERIQKELAARNEKIDWEAVTQAHPRSARHSGVHLGWSRLAGADRRRLRRWCRTRWRPAPPGMACQRPAGGRGHLQGTDVGSRASGGSRRCAAPAPKPVAN